MRVTPHTNSTAENNGSDHEDSPRSQEALVSCPEDNDIALFVSGSPAGVDALLLRELAAQAAFILAVDAGAEQLIAADLVPDLLIGDFDSITPSTLRRLEAEGVPVQSYDAYKNSTDVELGLNALQERGYQRCIATNVLGGRTDHALGSLGALAGAARDQNMHVALRDTNEACYFLTASAGQQKLELDFEKGVVRGDNCSPLPPESHPQHVSLIAWGSPLVVSIQGTEWPLDHYLLSPMSARGVSNELRLPILQVEVHEGSGTALLLLSYPH